MAVSQSHYRFGADSGTESTYPFLAAEDTGISFAPGVTFLLRICLQCDTTLQSNIAPEFQYNRNGAGWNPITTTSSVARAVTTAVFANAANTTKRLSGTGTFEATSQGCTHDGIAGGAQFDIVASGNGETVCAIQLLAPDVVDGDTIQFRLTRDGGILLGSYPVTPTLTVSILNPALMGAVSAQGAFAPLGGW
jgi:hypothetical protein